MQPQIPPAQLAAEFDALIRAIPNRKTLHHDIDVNHEWLGQAVGLVMLADPLRGSFFKGLVENLYSPIFNPADIIQKIIVSLQQYKTEWRMKSGGPLTVAFEAGKPFDYFDEVRKILESATIDVLVVDPYLGADFVSRYLPHVKPGVNIRLLIENQVNQVKPAVDLFAQQNGVQVEVRKSKDMHDRFIFIDQRECFHSGATFKDGAVKSATLLTQVTDAFSAMLHTYETAWAAGRAI
ncbi:hypothetical protein ACFQUU_04985 [Herbaspirillum sp. GCM10030257]|uniref:hypothetical protein n=1 Tax=Herbaspirillum sp. GCM10030257 TaxID=3273393 RepID=UPI0036081D45